MFIRSDSRRLSVSVTSLKKEDRKRISDELEVLTKKMEMLEQPPTKPKLDDTVSPSSQMTSRPMVDEDQRLQLKAQNEEILEKNNKKTAEYKAKLAVFEQTEDGKEYYKCGKEKKVLEQKLHFIDKKPDYKKEIRFEQEDFDQGVLNDDALKELKSGGFSEDEVENYKHFFEKLNQAVAEIDRLLELPGITPTEKRVLEESKGLLQQPQTGVLLPPYKIIEQGATKLENLPPNSIGENIARRLKHCFSVLKAVLPWTNDTLKKANEDFKTNIKDTMKTLKTSLEALKHSSQTEDTSKTRLEAMKDTEDKPNTLQEAEHPHP
jgi:hypothetical protein